MKLSNLIKEYGETPMETELVNVRKAFNGKKINGGKFYGPDKSVDDLDTIEFKNFIFDIEYKVKNDYVGITAESQYIDDDGHARDTGDFWKFSFKLTSDRTKNINELGRILKRIPTKNLNMYVGSKSYVTAKPK